MDTKVNFEQAKLEKNIGQYINVEKFFCCGKDLSSTELQNIKNKFWQDVFKTHIQLITKKKQKKKKKHLTENSFFSSPIFYIGYIK